MKAILTFLVAVLMQVAVLPGYANHLSSNLDLNAETTHFVNLNGQYGHPSATYTANVTRDILNLRSTAFTDPFAYISYDNYDIGIGDHYYADVTVNFVVSYTDSTPVNVSNVYFNYRIEFTDFNDSNNNTTNYGSILCNYPSVVIQYGELIQSDINNPNINYMREYFEEEGTGYYTRFTL